MKQIIFDWHCHHDLLLEPRIGTRKERTHHIVNYKPSRERPLRLRLFKRVEGKLPAELVKAGTTYLKTEGVSLAAYKKALRECMPQIKKLHAKECPNCPWDGRTIFSKGR